MRPEMVYRGKEAVLAQRVPAEFLRILRECNESHLRVNVYDEGATILLQFFAGEESVYLVLTARGTDNHLAYHVFSKTDPCFGSINPRNIEVRQVELDWDTPWEEVPMTEDEVYGACTPCMIVGHDRCADSGCTCCHGQGGTK